MVAYANKLLYDKLLTPVARPSTLIAMSRRLHSVKFGMNLLPFRLILFCMVEQRLPRLKRVRPPEIAPDNQVAVASLLDLAGTKVAVVQQRAEAKDYLDIEAILLDERIDLKTAQIDKIKPYYMTGGKGPVRIGNELMATGRDLALMIGDSGACGGCCGGK